MSINNKGLTMLSVLLSDRLSVSVRVSMFCYDTAVSVCLYLILLSLSSSISDTAGCVIYGMVRQYLLFVYGGGPSVSYPLYISPSLSVFIRPIAVRSVAIRQCPCPPGRGMATGRRLSALPCRHLSVSVSVSLSTYMSCPSCPPPSVWFVCCGGSCA
jgi:hypothetical protein